MTALTSTSSVKIGVALSGGGAAGMAHVGVLEELVAAGLPIRCVAGTSAGAMVGAAFANGQLEAFRNTMCELTRARVLRLFDPIWPQAGLLEGRRSLELVRPHLGTTIEALPIAFAAVATDLDTGEEVVLQSGSVLEAVRASIAIPGLFTPQRLGPRILVDGGLVNPIPADVARALGADFVIAVSVLQVHPAVLPRRVTRSSLTEQWSERLRRRWKKPPLSTSRLLPETNGTPATELGLVEILSRASTIVQARIAAARLRDDPPDFLIHVPVRLGLFDFHLSREAIHAGRLTARQALPELKRALMSALPWAERLQRWLDTAATRWSASRR
ncbi:MAG: patatin-like phospholipase family protein [Candidatus Binatia bacterium]|nr:patatin-like phospholipase family protein [Candidatus Binatia bacterium]